MHVDVFTSACHQRWYWGQCDSLHCNWIFVDKMCNLNKVKSNLRVLYKLQMVNKVFE